MITENIRPAKNEGYALSIIIIGALFFRPLAINGLGKFTKIGAALLIMGIVGGAILPPLYGIVSKMIDSKQMGYFIMIPCYLYILYYAIKGYKTGLK